MVKTAYFGDYDFHDKSWKEILTELLEVNRDVTEIQTNGDTSLFIKEKGKRIEIENVFVNRGDYLGKIEELIDLVISEEEKIRNPKFRFLVEGKLELSTGESARVHIVMPPATDYPQVTIAKKSGSLATIEALKETGSMNNEIYKFLVMAVEANLTIVYSGGTGAGKTTMLEALTKKMKTDDRIGVVEDVPELKLSQRNVSYYHSSVWTPGMDKNEVATLAWCTQQINRARTDKVIIGESRGGEFADFILLANSGMEGSMTSLHANTPRLALEKMTQLMLIGRPQPIRLANQQIANTVDIIVQLGKTPDGKNRVYQIEAIEPVLGQDESANIASQNIFTYKEEEDSWDRVKFLPHTLAQKLEAKGFDTREFELKKKDSLSSSKTGTKSRYKFGGGL